MVPKAHPMTATESPSARLRGRMAGPLAAVERFFERLFERPAARLFRTTFDPVQIERTVERVVEAERVTRSGRVYVPNAYRVLLNRADFDSLSEQRAQLAADLAARVRTYARAHGYTLPAQPVITIDASPVVSTGDVRAFAVTARPSDDQVLGGGARVEVQPTDQHDPEGGTGEASPDTSVFPIPRPNVPRAWLAGRAPNHPATRLSVRPGAMRIGRAQDNDIVLLDDRVSRHHGQVTLRLGMLVYTDLGSTNGSYVNGGAVSEIALGPGDVLQLGNSTVTIESAS